jgi:hypothetical protein
MLSRVDTRLECEVTCDGVSRPALILDISLKGAHLACRHLPAKGSSVTVFLTSPQLPNPLSIESTIVDRRQKTGARAALPVGDWQRFGVSFSRMVFELVPLLKGPAERPIYVHPGKAAR